MGGQGGYPMGMGLRIGLLASHTGTNAQAMMDACGDGTIDGEAVVLISNNSKSGAAERAQRGGVPFVHLSSVTHADETALDQAVCDALHEYDVELVVLAGYMKKIGPITLEAFAGRIVNTHPALLPKHGGAGMYGSHVHAAVLAAGDTESGVTIHVVTDEYDSGPTVAQARVPVEAGDTVDTLAARVQGVERGLYVATVAKVAWGEIKLPIVCGGAGE